MERVRKIRCAVELRGENSQWNSVWGPLGQRGTLRPSVWKWAAKNYISWNADTTPRVLIFAFFDIYKKIILSRANSSKILQKFPNFLKIQFCKICKIFRNFQKIRKILQKTFFSFFFFRAEATSKSENRMKRNTTIYLPLVPRGSLISTSGSFFSENFRNLQNLSQHSENYIRNLTNFAKFR